MSIVLGFVALVAVIAFAWLSRQGLTDKPWLETGAVTRIPSPGGRPTGRVGLGVFLAVVGGLFALAGSAVVMRMGYADWFALRMPGVVWLGTALLALASLCLQSALIAARRGDARASRAAFGAGALATLAFLAAQILAWLRLAETGQGLAANPGASFFFLISGLHGLHILGGLAALARVAGRLGHGAPPRRAVPGLELCAVYWHFLLLVWLAMLALLSGWASDVAALCRAILT
ncbi:cytochrome c oxidase subunit 3 [Limimaricola cinnabarinus]|uniref:cytochrome c oxidase subunit 3 n=1 Tax=Limimaricola cinnabarinus TaxID=1125964 RepID=UPI002FE31D14